MNKNLFLCLAMLTCFVCSARAGKSRTYCLTNSYGEQTTLTVVGKTNGVYTLTGSINYTIYSSGSVWPCTGTFDKATGHLHYVATNPNPDGCVPWAATVTFDYNETSASIFSGSFANDCSNSGNLSASMATGDCGFNPVVLKPGEYGSTGSHKMLRSQLVLPPGIDFGRSLSFSSISVSPNPVVREARINVTLGSLSKFTLSIYNRDGSLIKTVVNGMANEGAHAYTWNLQTQTGMKVRPGFYTVKLSSDEEEQSIKILVTE